MKYLSLVIAAIFIMWAGFCGAQETSLDEKIAPSTDVAEDADTEKEGSGVNKENLMPPGQTYDTNTGMPNAVESDTAGEIE